MSWTETARREHDSSRLRYASDCTDEERTVVRSLLRRTSRVGRPRKHKAQTLWDAIRLENEPGWSLEVENERGTSTVWDHLFTTDDAAHAAHAAFRQTIDEEGMRAFLDQVVVIPFRCQHGQRSPFVRPWRT